MKEFLSGIFCLAAFTTNAQYTATEDHTAAELLSEITGTGVTVLNPTLSCGDTTNGKYSGSGDLDFDSGIILSTGNISSTFPYVDGQPYYPEGKMITMDGMDEDVQAYWEGEGNIHTELFNACVLEFDVTTKSPGITLDAIFASAEYGFMGYGNMSGGCDPSGDVPFILIKGGVEYPEYTQKSVYPGTNVPVNGTSLYSDTTGMYASDCIPYAGAPYLDYYNYNGHPLPIPHPSINYSFFSKKIRVAIPVTSCDTYHVKMGIADSRSEEAIKGFSSALFVRTGSVTSVGQPQDCDVTGIDVSTKEHKILSVVPNPNSGQFRLDVNTDDGSETYEALLTDIFGRVVFKVDGKLSEINKKLHSLQLATGNYMLRLRDGGDLYQQKVTIL